MSKPRAHRYRVVDVFTAQAFEGNELAVFPDSSGIDDPTMQRIARELNLSETTFVAPATRADCVAQVRIFTPAREMVFAGHPTVGTSFVLLKKGMVPNRVEAGEWPLISEHPRDSLRKNVWAGALRASIGARRERVIGDYAHNM